MANTNAPFGLAADSGLSVGRPTMAPYRRYSVAAGNGVGDLRRRSW
jgi:hypothetical protein